MQFKEGDIYHIYNRGNNQQKLFFTRENYFFFLRKVRKYIQPVCDILSWTLMPNHFHFEIHANSKSSEIVKTKPLPVNALTEGLRLLLMSYTKALQKQRGFTGSLFQQKTKVECVDIKHGYPVTAFHYIHQNALKAGLVDKMEDWEFSSFPDYIGVRNGSLCNMALARRLFGFDAKTFYEDSYDEIPYEVRCQMSERHQTSKSNTPPLNL